MKIYISNYSFAWTNPVGALWTNYGLLQANDGEMLINDGEVIV